MSEKYLQFGKKQKHVARNFFSHPIEVYIPKYFFELCVSERYAQKLVRNWNNSVCIKVDSFPKSVNL